MTLQTQPPSNGMRPASESDKSGAVWEEYKYRHDLCWRLIFQITAVVVTLSLVPYLADEVLVVRLGAWILFVPLLAFLVTFFGLLLMQLELKLFSDVDNEYIKYRKLRTSAKDITGEYNWFQFVIIGYLIAILLLSLLNLFVIIDIWLPGMTPYRDWKPSVLHGRMLKGFACGVGLALICRGVLVLRRRLSLFFVAIVIWAILSIAIILLSPLLVDDTEPAFSWKVYAITALYSLIGVSIVLLLGSKGAAAIPAEHQTENRTAQLATADSMCPKL
jgi:hypothetical protein